MQRVAPRSQDCCFLRQQAADILLINKLWRERDRILLGKFSLEPGTADICPPQLQTSSDETSRRVYPLACPGFARPV